MEAPVEGDDNPLAALIASFEPQEQVTSGNWFGLPCLKIRGRVFAASWENGVAFRLSPAARDEALALDSGQPFDPRGRGKAMPGWIYFPASQRRHWSDYARLAFDFVSGEAAALKERLIDDLLQARTAILYEVNQLTPAQQEVPLVGSWGVQELLAHLGGWDETNRTALESILSGQRPAFFQEYDKDWASYNAQLVVTYRQETLPAMIALLEKTHRQLVDYLQAIPADSYLRHKSIATLLRAEASDEGEHARQIRAFRAKE